MMNTEQLMGHTADISAAFLSHNAILPGDVPGLITSIAGALTLLGQPVVQQTEAPIPATNPRTSVKPDHILSLIDGKPYKMLKRHISLHGYTPESYRAAFNLRPDYPMTAPNYAALRRDLAVKCGLGRDPHQARGRKRKAA